MNHEEMHAEFGNSLVVYMRTDDDGEVDDTRGEIASDMATQSADVFLQMMADVPYDVAAIFSGCAGVHERSLLEVRNLKGAVLKERLVEQRERRALPLRFVDGHPAAQLFEGFLTSVRGCTLYRDVAVLLARGFQDCAIRHLLRADLYEMMERRERMEYVTETEEESREDDDDDSV